MRHVYQAAILFSLTGAFALSSPAQILPGKLTVTNYQLLSEQRLTRTQSQYTYRADLVNTGVAQPALTATVVSAGASIRVLSGMGNLHFPPVPANGRVTSTNTFVVVVDRTGDTSFDNLVWSFNAPVANAGPDQTVPIGTTATVNASGSTNPSGIGTLTYQWVFISRPAGTRAVLQNASSVMASFMPDVVGDYVLALTVDNGVGTDVASVKISTVSSKPVADAGPDQSVRKGATVFLSGARSHDVDGNVLTYSWTLIVRPSRSNTVLTGANTVSPSFVADADGTYIAQLIVSDANGNSDPATVSVTTQNSIPVANAGANQVVARGATVQLNGAGSTDVDGDPLTYRWTLTTLPAGSQASLSSPGVINPTFVADKDGTYVAQLIVNDGTNDSSPSTVSITTNTIQPPVANAGQDQSLAHGSTVTLNGSGVDPQGLPLTYSWSLTTKPAGSNATLSNLLTQRPSFVADLAGTYVAQLIVSNGTLSSAPATVTISSTNTAPVANAGSNRNVTIGSTVTLDGSTSTDAESDPLTYSWSLLTVPAGSSASLLSPNIVSPTFVADLAGQYVAQLIVRDAYTAGTPVTVTITAGTSGGLVVSPTPLELPNAPGDLTITIPFPAGAGGQTVRLAALDPSVISVPSSVTVPEGQSQVTARITPLALGSTLLIATVQGLQPVTVTVNVTPPSITVSLSAGVVGISRTITGTVTLSGPAPSTGVDVNISADQSGIVNVQTPVHVNPGATTATFQITGATAGQVNITGSSPGYTSGSVPITVAQSGAISIQTNTSVSVGHTASLKVSLVSPAPVGGVTVNLLSSDTSKLTVSPSVFFSQGNTSPDSPAQITGVSFGTATVSASAPGFSGDSGAVQVGVGLSFTPQAVTINPGGTQTLTLGISGGAPLGGLLVTLASDNAAFATVPASVIIPAGAASVPVQVTGVGVGTATITASTALLGVVSGSATVTVLQGVAIPTSSLPVGVVGAAYSAPIPATGGTGPYTFSATGLPPGLNISPAGVISGTPSAAGTTTLAITVTDSSSPNHLTATVNLPLTINPALTITTTSLPAGTVGLPYSASVLAAGGVSPYTFSAAGLPAGLTINSAGAISGTPSAAGPGNVVITVSDSLNPVHSTATANLTLPVSQSLAVSTSSLPPGVVGTSYTASVAASGGTPPYTFTITGLPAPLTSNAAGQISGTPGAAGTSTVNVTVQDSATPARLTATASLSLTITPPALTIATPSLPNGAVGIAYSVQVSATGGTPPYNFTATGLPAGLTINSAGQISGTPGGVGTSSAAITVTDSSSPAHLSTTANLSITINPPVLAIATTSLPGGTVGVAYSSQVSATGGTPGYSFTASGLPGGLSMAANGQISGTPTVAGSSTVTVTVTDQATPSHGSASAQLTLVIVPPPLAITTSSLPGGTVGTAYNALVVATGGTQPYTFSAAGLPAGLSINASGTISGIPSAAVTASVTVTVTDVSGPSPLTATANFSLAIAPAPVVITTNSLPGGTVGTAYTAQVAAAGGTPGYTFSAAGLPAGLSMSAAGAITGTPGAAGTSNVAVTVVDSTNPTHLTATTTIGLTIAPPPLFFVTTSLADGTVGAAYNAIVSVGGGTPAYTFSATGLPAGVGISAAGVISGTPSAAGTSSAVITVTDSTNPTHLTATTTLAITIAPPPLVITTAALAAGTVGLSYSAPVGATGGTPPYVFTAAGLPAGLSIAQGGLISGQPTAAGTSSVVITVTDAALPTHRTATATLTLVIAPPPLQITSGFLPDGLQFTPYSGGVGIAGGTRPYNWNLISGTLPTGLTLNTLSGQISGIPTLPVSSSPLSFQITDSGNPAQFITANVTITIAPSAITPSLTVSGATVGQGLQTQITVALTQASPSPVTVTVSSSNPSIVAIAGRAADVGTGSLNVQVAAGTTSFAVIAQGLQNSGSAVITASAGGYVSGSSAVTASPSGFVLAGPNGVGASFSANQGTTTTLTISAAQLDSTGRFAQIQQVKGGSSVSVAVGSSASNIGTVAPAAVTFTGGTDSQTVQFNANSSTPGSTVVTASVPSGFTAPAQNANMVPVTVQIAQILPAAAIVGKNLQTTANVTLQGVAPADLLVTLVSNDPSKLLLSTNPASAGTASVTMTIRAGHSATPDFYVYGLANSGTATYNASAAGFGNANGTVTFNSSGFVLSGPFGMGQNFFTTTGSLPSSLDVYPAMLDASGGFLAVQALAGGQTVTVNLTATPGSVGTVTSPVSFSGGASLATTQFQPSANGSAAIAVVTPAGFSAAQFGSLNVSVITPKITIDTGSIIGRKLQQQGTIFLGAAAPAGGTQVTLTSNNAGALSFSATPTAAGSGSITITVPAGGLNAAYYMQALADTGTVTVTATAPNYTSGTGTETLAPSGVIVAGPFGPGFPMQAQVGVNTPVTVSTAALDTSGNVILTQPLAGGSSLSVQLSNSNPTVGTIPLSVAINGGASDGPLQFAPLKVGQTVISVTQPAGFTAPNQLFTSLTANVQ